jgi:DNA-directed RNA polymerase beta subunit
MEDVVAKNSGAVVIAKGSGEVISVDSSRIVIRRDEEDGEGYSKIDI